jgi:hypothetical protein
VNLDAIRRVEQVYRGRLRADPSDTLARVRLAWCLFAQAMHEAGQESVYEALRSRQPPTAKELEELGLPSSERGATSLLDDCLRQSYAALHLTASKREQEGAEELQALARLVSGEAPLARAEGWANDIVTALTADLNATTHPTSHRRLPADLPGDLPDRPKQ